MRFRDRCNAGERGTCRHNDDGHFVDDELDVDVHVDHHDHDDPEGGEGCTPGFWKNNADKKGASQWTDPYDPDDLVSSVFSAAPTGIGSKTLLAGLQQGGGQLDALTRHAIAAVLSAAHPDIDYPLTVDEIVDMVNAHTSNDADVIEDLKNELDTFNNLGCDISQNA